jgi:hypothetical protein
MCNASATLLNCWQQDFFRYLRRSKKRQMKQRIYIDTSVVGGYFDEEFKDSTLKLFERLGNNEVIFVLSDLLDLELITLW